MTFAIIIVGMADVSSIVICLLLFLSIIKLCYLAHFDPHNHPVTRKMELFNEVMLILVLYHLILSKIGIPIDTELVEDDII